MQKMESETATYMHEKMTSMTLNGGGRENFSGGESLIKNAFDSWQVACVIVAALMQYFLTAAFCWMLVEGIYLYLYVVKVYNINNKMTVYHVVSWGKFCKIFDDFIVTTSVAIRSRCIF